MADLDLHLEISSTYIQKVSVSETVVSYSIRQLLSNGIPTVYNQFKIYKFRVSTINIPIVLVQTQQIVFSIDYLGAKFY